MLIRRAGNLRTEERARGRQLRQVVARRGIEDTPPPILDISAAAGLLGKLDATEVAPHQRKGKGNALTHTEANQRGFIGSDSDGSSQEPGSAADQTVT